MAGCQKNCPGWPAEKCGDADKGLYIYIKMGATPSGTQPPSQSTSSVSAAPLPSPDASSSTTGATTVSTLFPFGTSIA